MSISGPAPKGNRIRRNVDTVPQLAVSSDGSMVGPDLPDDRDWGIATVRWYDAWRRSPQARAFEDTDWLELTLCAIAYQSIYYGGKPSSLMMAELRQRLSKFGATVEDRAKLRMRITHGAEHAPDDISSLTEQPGPDWRSRSRKS